MIDVGWVVAGVLALICVWLMWVVEKAYSTGINVGRTEVLEEDIARRTEVLEEDIARSKAIRERLLEVME